MIYFKQAGTTRLISDQSDPILSNYQTKPEKKHTPVRSLYTVSTGILPSKAINNIFSRCMLQKQC